jgi:hypothetical protein
VIRMVSRSATCMTLSGDVGAACLGLLLARCLVASCGLLLLCSWSALSGVQMLAAWCRCSYCTVYNWQVQLLRLLSLALTRRAGSGVCLEHHTVERQPCAALKLLPCWAYAGCSADSSQTLRLALYNASAAHGCARLDVCMSLRRKHTMCWRAGKPMVWCFRHCLNTLLSAFIRLLLAAAALIFCCGFVILLEFAGLWGNNLYQNRHYVRWADTLCVSICRALLDIAVQCTAGRLVAHQF